MFKKVAVVSLVLVFGSFILIKGAEASGPHPTGPRSIVYSYLLAISDEVDDDLLDKATKDNIRSGFQGIPEYGIPLREEALEIGGDFGTILNRVDHAFEGAIIVYEEVIAAVNKELEDFGYEGAIETFREKSDAVWEGNMPGKVIFGEPLPIDQIFGYEAGTSVDEIKELSETSVVESKPVYPLISQEDTSWFEVADEPKEVSLSANDWLKNWYVQKRMEGTTFTGVEKILNEAVTLLGNDEFIDGFKDQNNGFSSYLGHDFNPSNAGDLYTLFYFSDLSYRLSERDPGSLIPEGYGAFIDSIEAMTGQEYFKRERVEGESVITVDKKPEKPAVISFINRRIQLTNGFLKPMSTYYRKDLDLSKPRDAGKVSSAVTEVFNRIRTVNYNPFEKTWIRSGDEGYYDDQFDAARQRILDSINFALELQDPLKSAFGIDLPITMDDNDGEEARNFLNSWASKAVDFKDYGVSKPLEKLMNLLPGGENSESLISKINTLWQKVLGEDFDINSTIGRRVYSGQVNMIAEILSKPKYFNIEEGNFDEALQTAKDIIQKGIDEGLADVVSSYLSPQENFEIDLTSGSQSGIYTFWSQVLYVKGMDFVKEHINVRKDIRDALTKDRSFSPLVDFDLGILRSFESKLDPTNLEQTKNNIIDAIDDLKPGFVNLNKVLLSLPDPSREALEKFYPPLPQVGPVADALAVSGENTFAFDDNVNFDSCSDTEDNDTVSVPISPDGLGDGLNLNGIW